MKQTARRYGKIAINICIALIGALLVFLVLPKVLAFFMPFVIGWIIAWIASPLVKFLEEKLKIKRKAVTAFVIICAIALVIAAGYGIGTILIRQLIGFIQSLPELWLAFEDDWNSIVSNLEAIFKHLPENININWDSIGKSLEGYVSNLMSEVGTPTMVAVGAFAKNIPSVVISIIMCVLSAYFFISEKDYISQFWRKHTPLSFQNKWDMVFGSLKTAVGGYFKAQFKIEVWIYLILLMGLAILDVNYAVLIAFGMAILDLLPFFGTAIVLVPWALIKLLSADYKMFIGLLIIWGVSQLVRQLIQPKIVGDSIGVPPIPTLFLLFIGYKVAGAFGMIVAVPIGIIFVRMNEEGVFDTTKNSIRLFAKSINEFRKLDEEDMRYIEEDKADKEDRKEQ